MLIFATIVLDSSEISAWVFQRLRESLHSFEWLFFVGILEPSLDCSKVVYFATKSHIFCHIINGWSRVSKEPNYFHYWALSAKVFDDRGSSIIVGFALDFNIGAILRIWLFTRSIRLFRTPTTSGGDNITENLKWNLFGFEWRLYILNIQYKCVLFTSVMPRRQRVGGT